MARVDIITKETELFDAGLGGDAACDEAPVLVHDAAHGPVHLEFGRQDAHRHTSLAALAVRHVSNILAAAKPSRQQAINQFVGFIGGEMREKLALEAAWQIWAGLWGSHIELRKLLLLFRHYLPTLRLPHSRECMIAAEAKCYQGR